MTIQQSAVAAVEPLAAEVVVAERRRFDPRPAVVAVLVLGAAGLWAREWLAVDPLAMTDYGLVSLSTPAAVVALGLLTVGFGLSLLWGLPEWALATHGVTLGLMIHAVPVVVLDTLRYAWAWKHVGIVDFISRHGAVDPGIENLPVYHNWPGFFSAAAWLQQLIGADDVVVIAIWAPLAVTVANVLALRFALRALGRDSRRIWFAIWLFLIVNWVGQDYFAPQAFGFFLYLVLVGLVLRGFRRALPLEPVAATSLPARRIAPIVLILVCAIAWNHQLTPIMMILMLTALVLFRRIHGWYLPVAALAVTVGWAFTVAYDYSVWNLGDLLVSPFDTVGANLDKSAYLRGAAVDISMAGRLVVAAAGLLATVGLIRTWRCGVLDRSALLLMATPGALIFATAFGGEMLFRIVLFSSPFLTYAAASAVFTSQVRGVSASRSVQAIAVVLITVVLAPLFLLAYYGKDRQNYFTPAEVRVADLLYAQAPPNSLLIEGNTNYPRNLRNYEHLRYIAISGEPEEGRQRVLADPADVLSDWLAVRGYANTYLIITRSQKIANDAVGPMPPGALQRIEDSLRASPEFVPLYSHPHAVVFVLARQGESR